MRAPAPRFHQQRDVEDDQWAGWLRPPGARIRCRSADAGWLRAAAWPAGRRRPWSRMRSRSRPPSAATNSGAERGRDGRHGGASGLGRCARAMASVSISVGAAAPPAWRRRCSCRCRCRRSGRCVAWRRPQSASAPRGKAKGIHCRTASGPATRHTSPAPARKGPKEIGMSLCASLPASEQQRAQHRAHQGRHQDDGDQVVATQPGARAPPAA